MVQALPPKPQAHPEPVDAAVPCSTGCKEPTHPRLEPLTGHRIDRRMHRLRLPDTSTPILAETGQPSGVDPSSPSTLHFYSRLLHGTEDDAEADV